MDTKRILLILLIFFLGIVPTWANMDRSTYFQNYGDRVKSENYVHGPTIITKQILRDEADGHLDIKYPEVAGLKDINAQKKN